MSLKQLFEEFFHEWKVIPLFYIKKAFNDNFKFRSNLDYKVRNKPLLPKFYKKVLSNWMIYFTIPPELPFCILNQFLWCNKYVQINKKTVYFKKFSEHNIHFLIDLLEKSRKFKSWQLCKTEYNLYYIFYFQWLQLTDAISKAWKNIIQNNINKIGSLTIKDHHMVQRTRIVSINNLTAREL